MWLLVSGSRAGVARSFVWDQLDAIGEVDGVIVGDAIGVDCWARDWCAARGVSCEVFVADWARFGRGGGVVRNKVMRDRLVELGGIGVVFMRPGGSPGSQEMANGLVGLGLDVRVWIGGSRVGGAGQQTLF